METAPVVVLFEPSDEPRAMVLGRTLEEMGVRCWLEGLEGRQGPTRSQALAACRAVVVLVDEAGGAYGALDAGATWRVPVFVYGRHEEAGAKLHAFCERVAASVKGALPKGSRGPFGGAGWAAVGAGAVLALLGAFGTGMMIARRGSGPAPVVMAKQGKVRLTATQSGTGWTLVFQLPEPPSEVWYALGTGDFRQTGSQPGFDVGTGAALPKTYAVVGADEVRGPTTVRVKYRTMDGSMEGPFSIPFDPDAQAIASTKSILEDIGPQWIAFRDFNNQTLVYFTTLLAYKHVLRSIRVGVDDGPLDQNVRFSPSNRMGGIDTDRDELFRTVRPGTRSVSIELVFRDGSRSAVRTFPVRPEGRFDAPPTGDE